MIVVTALFMAAASLATQDIKIFNTKPQKCSESKHCST